MHVRDPFFSRRSLCLLLAGMITFGGLSSFSLAGELLPPEKTIEEVVDHYIQARHAVEKVTPAPQATDATNAQRQRRDHRQRGTEHPQPRRRRRTRGHAHAPGQQPRASAPGDGCCTMTDLPTCDRR